MSNSRTMRAAVHSGPLQFEMKEFPIPQVPDGWALVRVARCGICGSEKHGLNRAPSRENFICGHELSGVIARAPAGGEFAEGDAVIVHPALSCGTCGPCKNGLWPHCEKRPAASHGPTNAFAEYIVAPPHIVRRKPEGMDFGTAAMAEPVAVGLHAAKKMAEPGGNAVVFGAGGIGLLAAQCLKVRGAGRVFIADVKEENLKAACEIADLETIKSDDNAAWAALKGVPIHFVFDVVGHIPAITSRGLGMLARGGTFVVVGGQDEMPINLMPLLMKELRIQGSGWTTREDFEEAIALLRDGRVRVDRMIGATYPLAQLTAAFAASKNIVKVMVACGGA
ncbi:MAG: zinc-binding dehydrogenase [Planctomycetota bacterium]